MMDLLRIPIKKTSEEWQSIFPYPKVIDPDGWDRKNYDYSVHVCILLLQKECLRRE